MIRTVVSLIFFLFLAQLANAATVLRINEEKKTITLSFEADEIPECCKQEDKLKVENDEGEIGTYDVTAFRKKKKRVTLQVAEDSTKFKQDMEVTLSVIKSANNAEKKNTDDESDTTTKPAPVTPPPGGRMRSEMIREQKSVGLLFGGGLLAGSIPGPSLDIYYNLGSKIQLGINYGAGSTNIDLSDSEFSSSGKIGVSLAAARLRWFMWNNFNTSLLVGMRTVDYSISISSKTSANTVDGEVKTQSVVAGITIGNHWSFESGFTIGCDWFGYIMPLSSKSDSATVTSGDVSVAQEELAETFSESGEELGSTATMQGLIFTVGWAFGK
jgi:hypothetical protein